MEYIPYLWLLIGAVFLLAEIFTSGFVLCWFGLGAIAAGILSFLHVGFGLQILTFLMISGALTMASRTIFERFLMRFGPGRSVKTGMESLPGQVGTVVEKSEGEMHRAAVQVYGSTWTAYPAAGEIPLKEGEAVQVEHVDDSILYVRRVSSGPSWREEPPSADTDKPPGIGSRN